MIMGKKQTEQELLTYKWCLFFKYIIKGIGAKAISADSLVTMALIQPEAEMLCKDMQEAKTYALKAIDAIKAGDYIYLQYDPQHKAVAINEEYD